MKGFDWGTDAPQTARTRLRTIGLWALAGAVLGSIAALIEDGFSTVLQAIASDASWWDVLGPLSRFAALGAGLGALVGGLLGAVPRRLLKQWFRTTVLSALAIAGAIVGFFGALLSDGSVAAWKAAGACALIAMLWGFFEGGMWKGTPPTQDQDQQ